jgi:DNA replication protein DnaC
MEMHYLMSSSRIPPARQYFNPLYPPKEDNKAFLELQDIKENILSFIAAGTNLYIYSEHAGNGKTTWAIKLMQQYFNEVWAGNGFRVRGLFIHVPSFLVKIKEIIGYKDDEFEELRNQLFTADLVIWDDIAATKLGDYDHSILLTYIDQRNLNMLSNIYTGNLHSEALTAALGTRLSSRVWNESRRIKLVGNDRRSNSGFVTDIK